MSNLYQKFKIREQFCSLYIKGAKLLPYFEFLVQIAHLLRELISLFERPRLVGKIGIQNQSIPLLKVHVKKKYCMSSLWMCTKKKDVCLVIFLCCLSTCVCVCLQVQGPLRECPRAGRFRASLLLLTTYVRPDVIWSELENFMFERAHASFWVCSESNISKQILEARFLYEHPFQIRQGSVSEGSIIERTCVLRSDG